MKANLFLLLAILVVPLSGCLYPHIPTDLPTNGGAKIVISNMTLTTPWGTERIEYFESRAVENQTTNAGGFIPLAPKKP